MTSKYESSSTSHLSLKSFKLHRVEKGFKVNLVIKNTY